MVTGISTDVCLAFPAMAALADGFESYAVIDASGGFTRTQVDMGVLRMQQAGVVPVGYSNVAVEILADNASPEAEELCRARHAIRQLGIRSEAILLTYLSHGWRAAMQPPSAPASASERSRDRPPASAVGRQSSFANGGLRARFPLNRVSLKRSFENAD